MGGTSWFLRSSAWRGCRGRLRFRRCFAIILRGFYDRFDIGLEKNIKATKRHQYDIDQSKRLAENDTCQFIWFDDQRIQDTHLGFVSVGGLDIFYGFWSCDILSSNLHQIDIKPIIKIHQSGIKAKSTLDTWNPGLAKKNETARQRTLELNDSSARVWIFQRNQK